MGWSGRDKKYGPRLRGPLKKRLIASLDRCGPGSGTILYILVEARDPNRGHFFVQISAKKTSMTCRFGFFAP
jgi:hypothetical protein